MAASFSQMLALSSRAARPLLSPHTLSTPIASTSASSPLTTTRSFTCTPSQQGPKAAVPAKKKSQKFVKKHQSASAGRKRNHNAGEDSSQLAISTRFSRPRPDMNHIRTLAPKNLTLEKSINTVGAYSDEHLSVMQKLGLDHKVRKSLESHIRSVCLIRKVTADLVSMLEAATASPEPSAARIALTGPVSAGKSHLLTQAIFYALASDWLVIHLPRVNNLVDASFGFQYSAQEQAYLQTPLVRSLLSTILSVNRKALSKIQLNNGSGVEEYEIQTGITLPSSTTLEKLLETAARPSITPGSLQKIFDLFLASLSHQTEVPILFAMDSYQAFFHTTKYLTPDQVPLESYEMAPVRSFIRFLGGWQGQGVKRGAVISTVSSSTALFPVSEEMSIVLNEKAQQQGIALQGIKQVPSHAKIHALHLEHAKACLSNTSIMELDAVWSRDELKALYELRRQEGRNWNGGNGPEADIKMKALRSIPGAFPSVPGQPGGMVSEDELFLMRVLDSGGNPARFEAAIRGGSLL